MSKKIRIDQLSQAIADSLQEFTQDVIQDQREAVEEVSKEAHKLLKDKAPQSNRKRTKKYKSSIARQKVFESLTELRYILYSKSPNYRLTHLLEFGHALRNGGRTQAFPHFKYADDFIQKNLEKNFVTKLKRRN